MHPGWTRPRGEAGLRRADRSRSKANWLRGSRHARGMLSNGYSALFLLLLYAGNAITAV